MKEITRIVIKGRSGYVPVQYVYEDKFVITPDAVSYEYKPYLDDPNNPARKWRYTSNSPEFREHFETVCGMIPYEMKRKPQYGITDIGQKDFEITFSDKTKEKYSFVVFNDFFEDLFDCIKWFVPFTEMIPMTLRTAADEEEEPEIEID